MNCISIQQPWAWLIVHGHKPVENRTWSTKHRGPLLIHAGKKFDREGFLWVKQNFPDIDMPWHMGPPDYWTGGIVGVADLADVVTEMNTPWFFGPYGFVFENARAVAFLPMKGQLNIFKTNVTVR